MRIKLTLRGRGPSDIDLLVTTDNTATIGDIAATLATAGPEGAAPAIDPESVTLRLLEPASGRVLSVLAPTAYVTESGLRSGAVVDIAGAEQNIGTGAAKAAEMHIVSGPDKGMVVSLPFGSTTVGRAQSATVTCTDPMISKKHMRVVVGSQIEVHDLNSANGVLLGDQRVQRSVVGPHDVITIGDTQVKFVHLRQPEEGLGDSTDIGFIRPPQVIPHVGVKKFKLPENPNVPDKGRFPILAIIAPLIMGGVMYLMTRQMLSVVFMALSPLLMIGNWFDQWSQTRKAIKKGKASHAAALALLREDLEKHHKDERSARMAQHPPVEQVINGALSRDGSLWMRRPEHPEFLKLRVGIGTDQAAIEFETASTGQGIPECLEAARALQEEFIEIHQVPIVVDLRREGSMGMCGDRTWLDQAQAAVAAQLVCQYSPAEVTLACFTSAQRRASLQWLEWLPHVTSPHSPLGSSLHLADDAASGQELLSALEGVLEARKSAESSQGQKFSRGPVIPGNHDKEQGAPAAPIPAVVVLVDDVVVDQARLNRLAELGPDYGIHMVWTSPDFAALPAACRSFVVAEEKKSLVGDVRGSRIITPLELDRVRLEDVARLGRALSPVVDAGVPVDDDSDLPGSISYVQLTGKDLADNPDTQIERWKATHSLINRTPGAEIVPGPAVSLAALVGQGSAGPVALDLRSQGPHALVGGTTGAGKSEFLQAWVLGMAQAVSPDRLTFLFVDYKGGAAFARCTELPHCVGLVTDLSPFLVRRALDSLRAELHYREKLLNRKSAKDLVTLEKSGDPECPPSLVIVVDEFAALVSEVPEFVDGVVDVAQRGRSLGLHLILATQRPAGVIKDNLRANTNLRVALRMADTDDSQDVLGDRMAAHFPQNAPGRGAAKTGPGRITTFQSAYPGARTSEEIKAVAVNVEDLGFGKTRKWRLPELPKVGGEVETDIDRVVTTVRAAAEKAAIPTPRKPWLEELAQTYNIRNLRQRTDTELVLGVIDVPEHQAQVPEYFLPDREGNIAYYGASGSGKTTALRSLAIAAAITPKGGPVDVYGLDFAGGGLDMLKAMPHVGDVVPGDDEERVARLLTHLSSIVEERAARYSAVHAADLTNYRRIASLPDEPRILLLVDSVGVFVEEYQSVTRHIPTWNKFQQILLDGRAVGVHVAVTADRFAAIPTSVASNFQRKVVLRQTDEDAYMNFGLPKDVLNPTSLPGRAMQVGRPDLMQLAILGDNINALAQARLMAQLGEFMTSQGRVRPQAIGSLPMEIPAAQVSASVQGMPVIGVEGESLSPLPFRPVGTVSVAGGAQTGRSNALAWMVHSLRTCNAQTRFLHASSGRSALSRSSVWHATAQGASGLAEMLQEHRALFEAEAPENSPGVVLVIEDLGGFSFDYTLEPEVVGLLSLAKSNGHLVIVEADLAGWNRGSQLTATLKQSRSGLILCPGAGDGDSALGVTVPAIGSRELTPGRGYFTQAGKVWKVQVPLM
ncbi:FtsK/SpoIIIE domain-containing protein [Schaalia canis]|uniref:FHA domain-containing protein n=1 Tax=Schaalia canis TaxID=100469 RepID=A0A3P1SE98_9ACTO|nr:FtsK/SpoIIIE domain-containing protein [Schaalia canis]RRC95356.1 FHA domain-containing protein [Schaalia canis]